MTDHGPRSRAKLLWIAGYFLLLVAVLWGLQYLRPRVVQQMGTASEAQNWDDWRKAAADEVDAPRGVARKVPKSIEPPALVLMRDHYVLVMIAAVVFSTVLYGFTAMLLNGIFLARRKTPGEAQTTMDV